MKKKLSLFLAAFIALTVFTVRAAIQASDPVTLTWDFSEYTESVALIGDNYKTTYKGLELVGNKDATDGSKEFVKEGGGFHMNGTSNASRRYIKYTPEHDGKLTVTYRSNANTYSKDNVDRGEVQGETVTNRITAIGTEVSLFSKPLEGEISVPNTVLAYGFTEGSTQKEISADLTANKDYYIYFADGGQTIMKLEYVYTPAEDPQPVAETSYYVVGSMTDWAINDNYKLAANPEVKGEYMITLDLKAKDELKIQGSDDSWYPEGMDKNYVITEDGNYTIYFRPAGNNDWDNGFFYVAKNETVEPVDQQVTDDGWVMTDPADLATGDVVVIVDQNSAKAMANNGSTSAPPTATEVTLSDDKSQITSDVATNLQWVVTKDGDNYQFGVAKTENYLYCTNTNNGVRVGTNENNGFTIYDNGDVNFLLNSNTSRYVGVYNSQDWRCYTSINNNIKTTVTAFYKKTLVPVAVARPVFSIEEGAYTSALSVELTALPTDAKIFYTLDGSEPTAESTSYTGAISITETTTIKAIAIKDEDYSKIATATYTILESIANTEATAYTVDEAIKLIESKDADVLAHSNNKVFVKGKVSKVDSYNSDYKSITYWISEDGTLTSQQFEVYSGKGLNGADFASIEDIKVGADIIALGNVKKYQPKTGDPIYEFEANNELVKYTEPVSVEKLYIIGDGTENEWKNTTEVTFNKQTNAFEYEITAKKECYIAFGDAELNPNDWDAFNGSHRYALDAAGNVVPTMGEAQQLVRGDGTACVLLAPGYKYVLSVTKDLKLTVTREELPAQEFTATFRNTGNWEMVYAYTYSNNGEIEQLGGWPGTEIKGVDGVYTVTITGTTPPEIIIFNDGNKDSKVGVNKTENLVFNDGETYEFKPLQKFGVDFKTDKEWAEVYAYTYNPEVSGPWPGTPLKANNGIYTYGFEATEAPGYIIFNNGNGEQTPDYPFENGATYTVTTEQTTAWVGEKELAAEEALVVAQDALEYADVKAKNIISIKATEVVAPSRGLSGNTTALSNTDITLLKADDSVLAQGEDIKVVEGGYEYEVADEATATELKTNGFKVKANNPVKITSIEVQEVAEPEGIVFDFVASGAAAETLTKVNLNFQVNMGEGKEDRTDRNFRGYQSYAGTILPAECQVALGEEMKVDAQGLIVNYDRYFAVYGLHTGDKVTVIYSGVPEGKQPAYSVGTSVDTNAKIGENALVSPTSAINSGDVIEITKAGSKNYIIMSVFTGMRIEKVYIQKAALYNVTKAESITNGDIKLSATTAAAGDEVTVTATPADGYELEAITVKDADENEITVTDGKFIMPAKAVTVSATFKEIVDYYLVGDMTEWGPKAEYKLTLNTAADPGVEEYMFTLDLTTTNQFKIVKSDGINIETWYPAGMGNNYGENGEITEDGNYTVYFRPNADGGADWFNGVIYAVKNGGTGINGIDNDAAGEQGVYYNLQGVRVTNPGKGVYIKNGKKVLVK